MEITDELLDKLGEAIMSLPGINTAHHSYAHVEGTEGEVFIKFMSNGGKTDNENGQVLNQFLTEKVDVSQFSYFDGRKFIITSAALVDALGLEVRNG